MLKGCAEAVDAGVAVQVEKGEVVGDAVPVHRLDHNRWTGDFVQFFFGQLLPFPSEDELDTSHEQGIDGTEPSGNILEEVCCSTQCLRRVNGYSQCHLDGYLGECGDLVGIGPNAGKGDDVFKTIGVGGPKLDFRGVIS